MLLCFRSKPCDRVDLRVSHHHPSFHPEDIWGIVLKPFHQLDWKFITNNNEVAHFKKTRAFFFCIWTCKFDIFKVSLLVWQILQCSRKWFMAIILIQHEIDHMVLLGKHLTCNVWGANLLFKTSNKMEIKDKYDLSCGSRTHDSHLRMTQIGYRKFPFN